LITDGTFYLRDKLYDGSLDFLNIKKILKWDGW